MKKKFLSILLALCILLVPTLLVACEESGTETPSDSDITDLPDANVEVTVEEYPSLSYDTSTEKVTDESIAKGTLTVSYDQSETLTLWVAVNTAQLDSFYIFSNMHKVYLHISAQKLNEIVRDLYVPPLLIYLKKVFRPNEIPNNHVFFSSLESVLCQNT